MLRAVRKTRRITRRNQGFWVTLLSASLTAFLLGGLLSYWATGKLIPSAELAKTAGEGTEKPAKPRGPKAQLVRIGTIEQKSIVPVKKLVGDLIAVRRATIASEVAGKMVELPVDEGSRVVEGETLLARIDDTWPNIEVDKIFTQIAEKKATLKFERADLKRFEELVQQRAVSVSEAEQKRSLIEGLEASLAQLNVMAKEVNERVSRLEIYAPFTGSVVAKLAEVGEYLPIGTPIVEIVSSGRIDARIMVPEQSLPLLKIGDSVDLVVEGLQMELQGEVISINSQGSVGSRTFPVRVELDDQDGQLLPGMGVSVFVPVRRESTELLVPRDAVLTQPDESLVWILESNPETDIQAGDENQQGARPTQAHDGWTAHPVPVHVLSHTRDSYAIASQRDVDAKRLAAGVQVVTEGLERLVPGAAVRIDPDQSSLVSVPGTYRDGQQIIKRHN